MTNDVVPISSHRRYKAAPAPVPESFRELAQIFSLPLPTIADPCAFTYRYSRRAKCWTIGLQRGRLWICLTSSEGISGATKREARAVASVYAKEHNLPDVEYVSPTEPQK